MPICNWCGIDSKNTVTCDWCKRPIALQPQRDDAYANQRSGVDALVDKDAEEVTPAGMTPGRKIGIGVAMAAIAAGLGVFLLMPPSSPAASAQSAAKPPTVPIDQKFIASSAPAPITAASWANATPVFLPPPSTGRSYTENTPIPSTRAERGESGYRVPVINNSGHMTATLNAKVGIAQVKLKMVTGKDGKPICIGKLILFNDTNKAVNDYRLEFYKGNGRVFAINAFEGTIDDPQPLYSKFIRARGELNTPVLVDGLKDGSKVKGTVRMTAWLDGESLPVVDEIEIK